MSKLSIDSTYKESIKNIDKLIDYRNDSKNLESKYQYFIAEVIMLRLFGILEDTIRFTAFKLACNAKYRSAKVPSPNVICTSINDARDKYRTYNRSKELQNLNWSKVNHINKSIQHVLTTSEDFYININKYPNQLNEMRVIRNHIAHRSSSTYSEFKQIKQNVFSANLNITIGAFLTSNKRLGYSKIDSYLTITKVIIDDITKG